MHTRSNDTTSKNEDQCGSVPTVSYGLCSWHPWGPHNFRCELMHTFIFSYASLFQFWQLLLFIKLNRRVVACHV